MDWKHSRGISMLDDIKLSLMQYLYLDHLCSSQYPWTKFIAKNIFSAKLRLVFRLTFLVSQKFLEVLEE